MNRKTVFWFSALACLALWSATLSVIVQKSRDVPSAALMRPAAEPVEAAAPEEPVPEPQPPERPLQAIPPEFGHRSAPWVDLKVVVPGGQPVSGVEIIDRFRFVYGHTVLAVTDEDGLARLYLTDESLAPQPFCLTAAGWAFQEVRLSPFQPRGDRCPPAPVLPVRNGDRSGRVPGRERLRQRGAVRYPMA